MCLEYVVSLFVAYFVATVLKPFETVQCKYNFRKSLIKYCWEKIIKDLFGWQWVEIWDIIWTIDLISGTYRRYWGEDILLFNV